jgi:hypothetical protein
LSRVGPLHASHTSSHSRLARARRSDQSQVWPGWTSRSTLHAAVSTTPLPNHLLRMYACTSSAHVALDGLAVQTLGNDSSYLKEFTDLAGSGVTSSG